jgi:rhomboid protease GluP
MNSTYTKIKLLFLPFIILCFGFAAGYIFLYWLLFIHWSVLSLKEDVVQFWIPLVFCFILVLLFLRPRVLLFKLDKNNGKIRGLYYMVSAFGIFLPTIFLLDFTDTYTGKLTQLSSISDISTFPRTKYYQTKFFLLDINHPGFEPTISYSGKNNQNLNFDIYAAVPMTNDTTDTLQAKAFYYLHYHERHGRLSETERKTEWSRFWKESMEHYENDPKQFQYFERMGNTQERDYALIAAKESQLSAKETAIILRPIDAPFSERNGHKLNYALLSLGSVSVLWLIMVLIPAINENKAKKFNHSTKRSLKKQVSVYYKYLLPKPGVGVTWALGAINILVFVCMVLKGLGFESFVTQELVNWGAIYKPYMLSNGQWWRLVTSMFLHGGIMHLFMNMVSLYLCGIFLEPLIGSRKYLFSYFIAGTAAALFSMWWHDKPVVAVGASGAIFGLYGVMSGLIVRRVLNPALNTVLLILLACTAGYSLLIGAFSQGIDNSAHVGGLVCGLAIGLFYARSIKEEVEMKKEEREIVRCS